MVRNVYFKVGILSVLIVTSVGYSSIIYTGNLSSEGSGIEGTGAWISNGMTINWTVSQNPDLTWHYEYTFSIVVGDVSHMIIETSDNFTGLDIFNAEGPFGKTEIQWYDPGTGNPNMPDSVYGIKFDEVTGTALTISFDCTRMPVWGDFYAKGGTTGGENNSAWNAGFSASDPVDLPANGSINNHILVPDTYIPEPVSFMLFIFGLVGLFARKSSTK